MNRFRNTSFVILTALLLSCSTGKHEDKEEEAHDEHAERAEHSGHNHGEEGHIVVEPEDAARFGIKTAVAELSSNGDIIRVSGQIVNSSADAVTLSSPRRGIITIARGLSEGSKVTAGATVATLSSQGVEGGDPNAAARVALSAAKKELDRLKPLFDEGIVTLKEYNAALAAYQAASAAYSPSVSGGIASPIPGVITSLLVQSGQYVEAGTPVATVARNSKMLIRADLPEKYRSSLNSIRSANFRSATDDRWLSLDSLGGKRSDLTARDASVKAGFIPVYFNVDNNGSFSAGTYIDICLLTDNATSGITVPNGAITEQQGVYFVFAKVGDHEYEKRKVTLGGSDGITTRILSGVQPGDELVVEGATIVKLAENAGAVPEGHSHNH